MDNGWKRVKLGEVANYINGRAFKPSEWEQSGLPIIRIQNLNKDAANFNYTTSEYEEKYRVENGDLLFAWSASLGVYFWKGKSAWLNQHIFKVVPKETITKEFLFYTLDKITAELYAKAHGSGMVHVTKGKFESTEIFLPKVSEQQAIVSKLEELFSELDNGVESLKTSLQQLKVYRQAVLKWAFEGRLTNDNVKDGELPEGWEWKRLDSLGKLGRGKSKHRPRNDKKLFGGKYPFIQTGEVKAANHVIRKYEQTYSDFGLAQSKLWQTGTLCITIAANIAETAFLGFDGCFPDSIVGFTANENTISPNYIYYFFKANQARLEAFAPATAQKNINLTTLENLIIPYCSIVEQKKLVQEIESRLSVCDKIEETIANGLKEAEALRQSILKQAFEGKLV